MSTTKTLSVCHVLTTGQRSALVSAGVSTTNPEFTISFFPGMEPAALAAAVSSRATSELGERLQKAGKELPTPMAEKLVVHASNCFTTLGVDPNDSALVPLSNGLPDGLQVFLHSFNVQSSASSLSSRKKSNKAGNKSGGLGGSQSRIESNTDGRVDTDAPIPSGPVSFKSRNPFNKTVLVPNQSVNSDGQIISGGIDSNESSTLINNKEGLVENKDPELIADALERLNRFAAELSNERTLLAWIRTAMAAARTLFAYYALFAVAGTHTGWNVAVLALQVGVATFMFGLCITGIARFLRVKQLLRMKTPPKHFRRLSVTPLLWLICTISLVTTIGTYAQQWTRNKPK